MAESSSGGRSGRVHYSPDNVEAQRFQAAERLSALILEREQLAARVAAVDVEMDELKQIIRA